MTFPLPSFVAGFFSRSPLLLFSQILGDLQNLVQRPACLPPPVETRTGASLIWTPFLRA